MQNASTHQIRMVIKQLLKKHNRGYAELAEALNLSLPAVKRLMSQGDFTVSRLERIAAWFGLTLFEFLSIANGASIRPYEFSHAQEAILVKHPRAIHLLLLLGAGFPLSEAKLRSKLNDTELKSALFILDKINAIELGPGLRSRLLARGPFRMQADGPLRKKFFGQYLKHLSNLIEPNPSEDTLQIPFELYISNRLLNQFKVELTALYERYRSLSRVDHEISATHELRAVSGLILIKCHDGWGAILN